MEIGQSKVFILSAPSGSGKTTLVGRVLADDPRFVFSVSATTRPPRDYEAHGLHYYFLEEADFREKIAQGAFLEWEEVYPGRFYGTLKAEIDRIMEAGQFPILDIDVEGGVNVKKIYGERAVSLFIQAPGLDALRSRLKERGADSPEEMEKRLAKAEYELAFAPQFDHIIVNDNLETAVQELKHWVRVYTEG
ncbi:MAG: guanylate kinase [Bacteroidota bacterium]